MRVAGLRLTGDAIASLVGLVFSLWLFVIAGDLPQSPFVPIGPGFYPRLVLGATALASAALLVRSFLVAPPAPHGVAANYPLVVTAFVTFGLYVVLLPLLGYRIATVLFVAAMQAVIEAPRTTRAWVILAVIALATMLVTYVVFEHYLQVLLPRGTWTDF